MSEKVKVSSYLIFSFIVIIFTIILSFLPYLIKNKVIICNTDEVLISNSENLTCIKDNLNRNWYVIKAHEDKVKNSEIQINHKFFPNGVLIDISADDFAKPTISNDGIKFKDIEGINSSTTEDNAAVVSGFISNNDLKNGFFITTNETNRSIKFRLKKLDKPGLLNSTPFKMSVFEGGSRFWLYSLVILHALIIIISIYNFKTSKLKRWAILGIISSFLIGFTIYERPYRGMVGFIDSVDDTTYVAYAQTLLKDGDLFKCNTYVSFSRKNVEKCYGLPGTALMLLPGAVINGILSNESILDNNISISKLRGMRTLSALYSLLALVILFLTLARLNNKSINILLAISLLFGTSLSKWTFERSIFSHTSEMFLLSLIFYYFVLIYKDNSKWKYFFIIGFINGLLLLIRGEYLTLIPLMPLIIYFITKKENYALIEKKHTLIIKSVFLYLIASIGFVFYYLSIKNRMSGYGSLNSVFVLNNIETLTSIKSYIYIYENFQIVMKSFWSAGLILFSGYFLMIYSMFTSKDKSIYFVLFSFTTFYFVLTSLFNDPIGAEFQHRYFLKLYIPCLISISLFYSHLKNIYSKRIIWLIIIFSLVKLNFRIISPWYNIENDADFFERFNFIYSDSHFFLQGLNPREYFSNYTMSVFLFCFLIFFILISYSIKKLRN